MAKSDLARRSTARLAAVQAVYARDMAGGEVVAGMETFDDRRDEKLAEPDEALRGFLVFGTQAEAELLDNMVRGGLSGEWSMERLEAVAKAILMVGAFELKARPETPARVAISEYVDIAHAFYSGPEPKMVNAVLDRLARVLRPEEFT